MAASMMWIVNNMLCTPGDQHGRKLTEAELKVKRSLQKLSIPEWYLNKRSSPPKILSNISPVESRPSSWKVNEVKVSKVGSTSSLGKQAYVESSNTKKQNGAYKLSTQPQPKQKKTPSKEAVFDTTIPKIKPSMNISKTFPKMSPSRKIQNINIVFSQGPQLKSSDETKPRAKDSKHAAPTPKKRIVPAETMDRTPLKTHQQKTFQIVPAERMDGTPLKTHQQKTFQIVPAERMDGTPLKTHQQKTFQSPETSTATARTPIAKENFKIRSSSTPKYSPANLFSSTIIEDVIPKPKKVVSRNILEKSFIFEGNGSRRAEKSLEKSPKKLDRSVLERTWVVDSNTRSEDASNITFDASLTAIDGLPNSFLDRNMRSIDQMLLDDSRRIVTSTPTSVREIVKRLETSWSEEKTPNWRLEASRRQREASEEKKSPNWRPEASRWQKEASEGKTLVQARTVATLAQEERKPKQETESPCTKFLHARRKSIELENVVRKEQTAARENKVIRSIMETLSQKVNKPSSSRHQVKGINQNFVKKLIDALEKGGILDTSMEKDEDTGSESLTSVKDTDSNSDLDQRSPWSRSDEDNRNFGFEDWTSEKSKEDASNHQDDDSVYWIPVPTCNLPRTSSTLSVMPASRQSPCISPIRSDTETETWQTDIRGATYRKSNILSRRLFRIDETTVIDSGYSDKSDRSESALSEDNLSLWNKSATGKRSSRQQSVVGQTYYIY